MLIKFKEAINMNLKNMALIALALVTLLALSAGAATAYYYTPHTCGTAMFGDYNHNGIVSMLELSAVYRLYQYNIYTDSQLIEAVMNYVRTN